jgi:hypothetical protein
MDTSAYIDKVVEILPAIQETELDYFEAGMLARVKAIKILARDMTIATLDVTEFEESNAPLEKANYYDSNGTPCLTARQAGSFKACGDHYLEPIDTYEKYFRILPEDPDRAQLFADFQARDDQSLTYVRWCEIELIKLRQD